MGMGREWGAYTTAIRAIALVAYGTFTHDPAVGVGGFIRDDVAGAAAAVGDAGVGHCCCGGLCRCKKGGYVGSVIFQGVYILRAMLE